MSRFIKYHLGIGGKRESDVTEDFMKNLQELQTKHPEFGIKSIGIWADRVMVCGIIIGPSKSACNGIFAKLQKCLIEKFDVNKITSHVLLKGECEVAE